MKLEVFKGRGKQAWRWRARARNGKIVACAGEGFPRRYNALRAFYAFLKAAKAL